MSQLSTIAICDRLSDLEEDLYQSIVGQLRYYVLLADDKISYEQYKAYTDAYSSLAALESSCRQGISHYSKLLGCTTNV